MTSFKQPPLASRSCDREPWAILTAEGWSCCAQHCWREHGNSPTVGMALREFWPQPEDTEVTLPHFFPGTMSVQADPLPSALPLLLWLAPSRL